MTATNHNCLTCKQAQPLPKDIQGNLTLGEVAAFNTDYSVTICDQNRNELYKSNITSGGAGEMVVSFGAESVGIFHEYFSFSLMARNLSTGEIDTITATNGITADCIELNFECSDQEGPYNLVLDVEKVCNCDKGCDCP